MPEEKSSIFNPEAQKKLQSADSIDKVLQVANPSIWVLFLAIVFLAAGLLAWGFGGTIATNITARGVVIKDQAMCFLPADEVSKAAVGNSANFGGKNMTISRISDLPLSNKEIGRIVEESYLLKDLVYEDWAYQVFFEGDTSELVQDVPLSVNITVDPIAPISVFIGDTK